MAYKRVQPWQKEYRAKIKGMSNAEILNEALEVAYDARWRAEASKAELIRRLKRSWFYELDEVQNGQ